MRSELDGGGSSHHSTLLGGFLHVSNSVDEGKAAAVDHCAKLRPTGRNSRRRILIVQTLGG